MQHYHIRWTNSSGEVIDWESFNTREEAQAAAIQLRRPNENYAIVQFDSDCPRCTQALTQVRQ